jgi:hypothetical protein
MTFASPTKASGEALLAELEKEVTVKRVKDGTEMTVPNRLAIELCMRKPVEFEMVVGKTTAKTLIAPDVVAAVDAVVETDKPAEVVTTKKK